MQKKCPDCISRRDVVTMGAKSAAALGVGWASASLLSNCGSRSEKKDSGSSTPVSGTVTTGSNNQGTLDFTTYPNLQNVNGSYKVSIVAQSGTKTVVVTRGSTTTAYAVSPVCTHAGCSLDDFNASSDQLFHCPCHGASFKASGAVVSGPAQSALSNYTAEVTTTGIVVTVA